MTIKNLVRIIQGKDGLRKRLVRNAFIKAYNKNDYDLLEYLAIVSKRENTKYFNEYNVFYLMRMIVDEEKF